MKMLFVLCLLGLTLSALHAQEGNLDFIKNQNQFPDQVRYKAFLPGGAVFLTQDGFTYNYYKTSDLERIHEQKHKGRKVADEPVHFHAYHVRFSKANKEALIKEEEIRPYYHNYFIGNDPTRWAGNVPLYKKITWQGLYAGIDAIVYSRGSSLKYDFVVQPGADPAQIVMAFDGVQPQLDKNGSLQIHTTVNTVTEQEPYVYQRIGGEEIPVKARYKALPGNRITFDFPEGYNKMYALVIDPVLVFSTFSGSTADTYGFSATYDPNGNLYAGGECFDVGWPVTAGAFQTSYGTWVDAGLNKYSSNGSTLLFSTYYGGSGTDLPNNMMVNMNQELVICGTTTSVNLPVSTGCYDNSYGGGTDIYIARFSSNGSQLKAATYLGGDDDDGLNDGSLSPNYGDANRGEVLAAANGSIYIAGSTRSSNFPVTATALQSSLGGWQDGVVCRLDSNLTTLNYSTFIGGSDNDAAFSLVLTSTGEIAVCGGTASTNFPTTSGALHTSAQGDIDGFASIINTSTGLVRSTYLGTSDYDHAFKIQIDATDNIFVMGQTAGAYPVSPTAYSVTNGDIFIAKLNPVLSSQLLSTRMGNPVIAGSATFVPAAFMLDVCGNTYLSGFDAESTAPLSPNAYQTAPGSFWLGALGPGFGSLLYGTFFGPLGTHVDGGTSRFDPQGVIYHSACTDNSSFPTTPGAAFPVKLNLPSDWDIASFKFNMEVGAVLASFALANNANDTGCAPYVLTFENNSVGATDYAWDFGDGTTSTAVSPTHTFTEGSYNITLIASRVGGCNPIDTATMTIFVKHSDKPLLSVSDTFLCDPVPVYLKAEVSNLTTAMSFHWEPVNAIISNPNQAQIMVNPALSTTYTVQVGNAAIGECVDTATGTVTISLFDYSNMKALPLDTTICPGDTILLRAYGGTQYLWSPNQTIEDVQTAFTTVWPRLSTDYKVLIMNDSGCKIERTVAITTLPPVVIDAGEDQDIKLGESTRLNGRAGGAYVWTPAGSVSPDNILNPEVGPSETTTYYLTVKSTEGCLATDTVTVHVTNAFLPNAFSPNGDGKNDLFLLAIKDKRVVLKDFSVYNRFGQRVFFSRNVLEGWDGYYNGTIADMGTYFYLVRYKIGTRDYSLKGDVALIR